MVKNLLPLIPKHDVYVEPFAGACWLLLAHSPSKLEVINDINHDLINFYSVLRDPEQFKEFRRLANLTLYAREEWNRCKRELKNETDPIKRAYEWYVVQNMSFGGNMGQSWGYNVDGTKNTAVDHFGSVNNLPAIHNRLKHVQVECRDWKWVLQRYTLPNIFCYNDPPYAPQTRRGGKYKHEMTMEDHAELVQVLLQHPAMNILSCYDHLVYKPLEDAGWRKLQFETVCHMAGRTQASSLQGKGAILAQQPRVETVYLNPACVRALKLGVQQELPLLPKLQTQEQKGEGE